MPDLARPIGATLADSPETAALAARIEAARRASDLIAPLALALNCGFDPRRDLCELRDGILRLAAASPAQGAKLRQAVPRFQAHLSAHGIQVYEIRISVQAGASPYPGQGRGEASSSGEPLPPVSARAAENLARDAAGIGGALGAALGRLAKTLEVHSRRR